MTCDPKLMLDELSYVGKSESSIDKSIADSISLCVKFVLVNEDPVKTEWERSQFVILQLIRLDWTKLED